jgi:hypothetical protein
VLDMQQMRSRSRRRTLSRLGGGIAITLLVAQFRPATGKAPEQCYRLRDRTRAAARRISSSRS